MAKAAHVEAAEHYEKPAKARRIAGTSRQNGNRALAKRPTGAHSPSRKAHEHSAPVHAKSTAR